MGSPIYRPILFPERTRIEPTSAAVCDRWWWRMLARGSDLDFVKYFRLRKHHVIRIAHEMPVDWKPVSRHTGSGRGPIDRVWLTGASLRRLASAGSLYDLMVQVGRGSRLGLTRLTNEWMAWFAYRSRFARLLDPQFVFPNPARVAQLSAHAARLGIPLQFCIGFIDGTKIIVARPARRDRQWPLFSGHKRRHCLTYMAITVSLMIIPPCGRLILTVQGLLLYCFYGPETGMAADHAVPSLRLLGLAGSHRSRRCSDTALPVPYLRGRRLL